MLLQKFYEDKKLADSSRNLYNAAVKIYESLTGKTLDELIHEADDEEEKGIRWKRRTLKTYLITFRNYVYSNYSENTAKRYFSCIKTIYLHFEIEIHKLPSFNSNQIRKTYQMDFDDLLTKEELIDAYYEATNLFKCLILFGISTGFSKVDMLNLTVRDWIGANENYITISNPDDIISCLLELKNKETIPCFRGNRKKTKRKYTTFCSPEAAEHINQYLIGRDVTLREEHDTQLQMDDPLFDVTPEHVSYTFTKINRKLNLGKVGECGKFRCHMLRKFHASRLRNCPEVVWTIDEIDTLQGRSMDMTHEAYFKNSREKLYEKYVESVDELMLFKSIHAVDEEEYNKVKSENDFYKNEIVKNEQKMEEQKNVIAEIKKKQEELEAMLKT